MKKYVPIVTDDPQDNVEAALNLVFIKDEEVYVRGYGPAPDFSDATLSNVTRDILQKYSPETLENVRLKDDLELSCATSEWLFDGIDTIEGVVALLYTMAWAFAETRERLRMYEETRLSPLDLKDRADRAVPERYVRYGLGSVQEAVPRQGVRDLLGAADPRRRGRQARVWPDRLC